MEELGRYQIREVLGQGAMGTVYKAWDTGLNRMVALKTMASSISHDPELKIRFYREAQSAAHLQHPNIITIFDFGEVNQRVFISMELVEGSSLKQVIEASPPLDQKLHLMAQVLRGLGFAHKNGVVHRDVKPGNILVTRDGVVKILDFGVAHLASSDLTRTGSALGTPEYMSPETVEGRKIDRRSDIFSCGIVFYELLTQVKPFYDDSLTAVMEKVLSTQLAPVSSLVPGIPPTLDLVVSRMLQKNPDDRYQDAEAAIEDLRELQSDILFQKADKVRELKSAYQVLAKIESDVLSDDFARLVIERDMGKDLRQVKDRIRTLDPSSSLVTLAVLDQTGNLLDQITSRLRAFVVEGLPRLVAERDRIVDELEAAVLEENWRDAEGKLEQLNTIGCPVEFVEGLRAKVQIQAEEARRRQRIARAAEAVALAVQLADKELFGPALEAAKEALTLDPENQEAARLIREIPGLRTGRGRRFSDLDSVPAPDEQASPSEEPASQQLPGAALLAGLVAEFLKEAEEDFSKGDYGSCRKSLKRVLQLSPQNPAAIELKNRLESLERGHETIFMPSSEREQTGGDIGEEVPEYPQSELETAHPAEPLAEEMGTGPRMSRTSLLIISGAVLVGLAVLIGLYAVYSPSGSMPGQLALLDQSLSDAMTRETYKTRQGLDVLLVDIGNLSSTKGGKEKAESYLTAIKDFYLSEAIRCEEQSNWPAALENYQTLNHLLGTSEYEEKISQVRILAEAGGQLPPVEEPAVVPSRPPRQPAKQAIPDTKTPTPLELKLADSMKRETYKDLNALPGVLQDLRNLASQPSSGGEADAYLSTIRDYYLFRARLYEQQRNWQASLETYQLITDSLGVSGYEGKQAELLNRMRTSDKDKEIAGLQDRASASLRNQNLFPPAPGNAWDLMREIQRLAPDHPAVRSTAEAIRQRLDSQFSESLSRGQFLEAKVVLERIKTYFPEDKTRSESRELELRKAFYDNEITIPVIHLHGDRSSCTGTLRLMPAMIRYVTDTADSRTLAFGAIERLELLDDRIRITLKIKSTYEYRYAVDADRLIAEEWLRNRLARISQ
jgi:serine/threonine protein kinase